MLTSTVGPIDSLKIVNLLEPDSMLGFVSITVGYCMICIPQKYSIEVVPLFAKLYKKRHTTPQAFKTKLKNGLDPKSFNSVGEFLEHCWVTYCLIGLQISWGKSGTK